MLPVAVNMPGDCATADDASAISISNRLFMATLPSKMYALVVTQTLAYDISSFAYSDDSIVIEFSSSRVHGSGGKVIANNPSVVPAYTVLGPCELIPNPSHLPDPTKESVQLAPPSVL
jgi:hypothetical protein